MPLGVKVSTSFANKVERVKTGNVLGVLPGSDPKLKEELVVYTAHHDHLGRKDNPKKGEDAIYNGAVDNASGVASMLSVARAMTSMLRSSSSASPGASPYQVGAKISVHRPGARRREPAKMRRHAPQPVIF